MQFSRSNVIECTCTLCLFMTSYPSLPSTFEEGIISTCGGFIVKLLVII